MEHPEKSGLSTPIHMPSQETFNTNLVGNFSDLWQLFIHLILINVTKVTVISRWQTNADLAESQNQIQFGAKERISSRTELKEPFG
jgi:hypothetical protein